MEKETSTVIDPETKSVDEQSNFKTIANMYEHGLKDLSLVAYHMHRSTGQNIRSVVRNMIAKDIMTMIKLNEEQLKDAYDNFRSEVQKPNDNSQPV